MIKQCLYLVFTLLFVVSGFSQDISCANEIKFTFTSDNKITLTGPSFKQVERSEGDINRWETIYFGLSATTYTDETAESGKTYMYRLSRNSAPQAFAIAGIEVPPIFHRGRLLLLVDETHSINLAGKIQRWISDAEGDGWNVITETIDKTSLVTMVKQIIKEKYQDEIGLQAVFLLGHIPVPYSGNVALDGHSNHSGAWPADTYYAELNEQWTDTTVNSTAVPERTKNIPGDGKFDQSFVRELELQIGRVDFYDMPALGLSEEELLEKYLDKNHAFKRKIFTPRLAAFSQNNILNGGNPCTYAEMYPALVGTENFVTGNYRNTLTTDSYLFAYGAGFANFTSASGISNTTNMGIDSLQAVFTGGFGSYFGDWDNTDNYLRSHLASGTILTTHYTNRFKYFRMGIGSTIGLEMKLSASTQGHNLNSINGVANYAALTLLGDPTLRMLMVYPVTNEEISYNENVVRISWEYLEDAQEIDGFNIYRKSPSDKYFIFQALVPANQLEYNDQSITESGETKYMVRTQKLENVLAGSYYNQSIGKPISVEIPFIDLDNDGFDSFEDCDDDSVNVFPGQEEIENTIDDNCNGYVDEVDSDGDGFFNFEDCDDENSEINPLALEIINNGIDENCDGIDDLNSHCYQYDGIPSEVLLGIKNCDDLPVRYEEAFIIHNSSFVFEGENNRTYSFDYCEDNNPQLWQSFTYILNYNRETREIGDLVAYNEGCELEFKFDATMALPQYLIVVKNIEECSSPQYVSSVANGILTINCVYIDQDQDGFFDYEDCDDSNAMINSDQVEIPFNGLDDDCDESTLDNDGDQDGSPIDEDCDDNNPLINPEMIEITGNGIDEDCDGIIDEVDMDGDGFADFEDCDDTNSDINPGVYDYANNGIDEDCDGVEYVTDACTYYFSGPWDDFEGLGDYCLDGPIVSDYAVQVFNSFVLYDLSPGTDYHYTFCDSPDSDSWTPRITIVQYDHSSELEGKIIDASNSCEIFFNFPYDETYPDILIIVTDTSQDCNAPTSLPTYGIQTFGCVVDNDGDGYVAEDDCDDNNPNINPDQIEEPYNGIDDDCDPATLDDDIDQDGFLLADDCDDNDPNINPFSIEVAYNGIDEDCNAATLDDDLDQDGFLLADDCDDNNADINPDAIEIANNDIDEDCDGNDLITSILELGNTRINVYPNPASDIIIVDLKTKSNFSIGLYDLLGHMILTQININEIDVSELMTGTYFLVIEDLASGQRVTNKIFVVRK